MYRWLDIFIFRCSSLAGKMNIPQENKQIMFKNVIHEQYALVTYVDQYNKIPRNYTSATGGGGAGG